MMHKYLLPSACLLSLLSGCASEPAPYAAAGYRSQSGTSPQNLASPGKLIVPRPVSGNRGRYMSPFTSAGTIALWAQERKAEKDNGSEVAAAAGGVVGQYAANKALDFVPFGLGGMVGKSVGESAGRAATRKTIDQDPPSIESVKASSDISFKTIDELAVYMYARHSSHPQYQRVLNVAQLVYPELRQRYTAAIEKAPRKGNSTSSANKTKASKPAAQAAESEWGGTYY